MILMIANAIAEEKISITIFSGPFFNVPEVIVYEKSIPHIYTQIIIIKEKSRYLGEPSERI